MGKSKSPSKRKGKKGKKSNLTDEEKKKLAEQKALAEREKLVARQNLTKAFLKVKKDKEYELVKLNSNKILDLWRPHLRKQKIKELLEDYKQMKEAFEKALEKKTQWIKDLENNFASNEKDYEDASNAHLYQIDKMMEFYETRLRDVEKLYNEAKTKLYAMLEFETKRIQDLHSEKMEALRRGMKELTEGVARTDREARAEQYGKLVEIRQQGNHELYLFRTMMNEKVNKVWEDLHHKILGYVNANEDKKKELMELLIKDEDMSKSIDALYHERGELVKGIQEMKRKKALFTEAFDIYMLNIKEVRDRSRETYNKLQDIRKRTLKTTKTALMDLALTVHGVQDNLESLVSKREKVVALVGRILDVETETERIDPFLRRWGLGGKTDETLRSQVTSEIALHAEKGIGLNRFNIPVDNVIHQLDCDCPTCHCENEDHEGTGLVQPMNEMINTYSKLERFWIRYNKVALEREAIMKERDFVMQDNRDLKMCVRYYMTGMNPPGLDSINFSPSDMEENTKKIRAFLKRTEDAKKRAACSQVGVKKIY